MTGLNLYTQRFLMQILIMFVLLFGSAEAKGIETELWGIGWDASTSQVKQALEAQGFEQVNQGKDSNRNIWIQFDKGQYSSFLCNVNLVWQAERLTQINIESTGKFLLGTESTYKNLVAKFADQYGRPQRSDSYMLKSFPGIWVEWVQWNVTVKGSPSYTVTLSQYRPAFPGPESAESAKITILFARNADNCR